MVLSAQTIRKLCLEQGMITPFSEKQVSQGKSYGLSASSYDLRIDQNLILFPGWGRLASTIERLKIPNDIAVCVADKSSWARVMVQAHNTFIDPGFEGWLTLELTRSKPWPIYIKNGSPIVQLIFFRLDETTELSYSGKYNNQKRGPQKAILEK